MEPMEPILFVIKCNNMHLRILRLGGGGGGGVIERAAKDRFNEMVFLKPTLLNSCETESP